MSGQPLVARFGGGSGGSIPALPDAPNAAALLAAPYVNAPHDSTVWLIDHARDVVSVPVGTVDAIPGNGSDWLSLTQPPPAANVAELATVKYAHVPRGQSVYVISRFRNYVSVPLGNGEEGGTGNEWKSDPSTSSPGQRTIAAWWFSNAGSDDNAGDLAHPLATMNEYLARLGVNPEVTVNVTLTLLADFTGDIVLPEIGGNGTIHIKGTPTIVHTDTLSAWATFSHGAYNRDLVTHVYTGTAPKRALLSATGVADFNAYVDPAGIIGYRLRAGSTGARYGWIDKAAPTEGSGLVSQASISNTGSVGVAPTYNWSVGVLATAQNCFIETMQLVHNVHVSRIGGLPTAGVTIVIEDIACDQTFYTHDSVGGLQRVSGCDFRPGCLIAFGYDAPYQAAKFQGCRLSGAQMQPNFYMTGCYCLMSVRGGTQPNDVLHTLVAKGGNFALSGLSTQNFNDVQFFDCTATPVACIAAALFIITGVSGNYNAAGGLSIYTGCVVQIATVPNILCAQTEFNFGLGGAGYGTSALYFNDPRVGDWSVVGDLSGSGALTAGVLPVVLPALSALWTNYDINVSYVTPGIVSGLGYDTKTNTGFRVNNGNVADNTTQVTWRVRSKSNYFASLTTHY